LNEVVCRSSRPDLDYEKHGEKSSKSTRRLNPRFVAYLMGWPLTDFGFSEMGSCPSRPPMPLSHCGQHCEPANEDVPNLRPDVRSQTKGSVLAVQSQTLLQPDVHSATEEAGQQIESEDSVQTNKDQRKKDAGASPCDGKAPRKKVGLARVRPPSKRKQAGQSSPQLGNQDATGIRASTSSEEESGVQMRDLRSSVQSTQDETRSESNLQSQVSLPTDFVGQEGTDAGWRNWRSCMRHALVNLVERIATQEETQ
jgi:hypothetical protein